MQKMEKRSWILSPQTSIKKIKQERNFISDEERRYFSFSPFLLNYWTQFFFLKKKFKIKLNV